MTTMLCRRAAAARVLATAMLLGLFVVAAAPAGATGNAVMPPNARPHGYSLADIAAKVAQFTSSGNDPAYLPKTPFQVLYAGTFAVEHQAGGVVVTGSNNFTVKPGTFFYVPVVNVDDSPAILGTFPTSSAQAANYLFDPAQGYGARDYQVVVDGVTTPLGASYVAGPVTTPPLLDGGGTHIVTLGVFLHPLTPGVHTISISGEVAGALLQPTYGIAFNRQSFTYTVTVTPGH